MKPYNETTGEAMKNKAFRLVCWKYLFDQFRIQITNEGGGILQELCTYEPDTYSRVWRELSDADDPLALACSWARPWNREGEGRIRLDTTEADNPYRGKDAANNS